MTHADSPSIKLARALHDEHVEMEALLTQVMNALDTADRQALHGLWDKLEHQLRAHLDWEESALIPRYRRQHAQEADQLLREHSGFRTMLTELGMAIDLRHARAEAIQEFLTGLRSHAALEDVSLYAALCDEDQDSFRGRVRRVIGKSDH